MADVILFGSANTEEIVVLRQPYVEGTKLLYDDEWQKNGRKRRLPKVGGSAVNWSFWLNAAGHTPMLFGPIGNDPGGEAIRNELRTIDVNPNPIEADYTVRDETASHENVEHTRHSYIIVHDKEKRTVLSDPAATERWLDQIDQKIGRAIAQDQKKTIKVAMIGNIPTETSDLARTTTIISALKQGRPDIFVYVNMGRAQADAGHSWCKECWNQVDVFQFGLDEAKTFVARIQQSTRLPRLHDLVEQFVDWETNVVITLGRGGAISVFPRNEVLSQRVFFTWPICAEVKDPTGSGDALGAGFVAALVRLYKGKAIGKYPQNRWLEISESYLCDMLNTAGIFASRACEEYGGSTACPRQRDDEFRDSYPPAAADAQTTYAYDRQKMKCALYALDQP